MFVDNIFYNMLKWNDIYHNNDIRVKWEIYQLEKSSLDSCSLFHYHAIIYVINYTYVTWLFTNKRYVDNDPK